jgi:UDP-N-acetyl-D-galactosamine dehydrogenase
MIKNEYVICIIGLGYVGLPLSVEFAKHFRTIGYDINQDRVSSLKQGIDKTKEVDSCVLKESVSLMFTSDPDDIAEANIYIVSIPTPVDKYNNPDLGPIENASREVARYLKVDDIVIYESTVYPGVTEDICVPLLEAGSRLKLNEHFFCGYSPERINPGDKLHTLTTIKKITSGSNPVAAEIIDKLYRTIIKAGTFKASSIKVAEAAKVIENAQRDINIAFVNELAKIFNLLNIDTNEVLEAASTKWNFLNFKPGLVGGHCIGVDPFYLAHKAKEIGYHSEIILAGRRLNDSMGSYVANQLVKLLIRSDVKVKGAKVLILGITFKENCPDIRNSRVIDIINELKGFGVELDVYDPWADKNEVFREHQIQMLDCVMDLSCYSGVLAAVGHECFKEINLPSSVICYDLKGIFQADKVSARL